MGRLTWFKRIGRKIKTTVGDIGDFRLDFEKAAIFGDFLGQQMKITCRGITSGGGGYSLIWAI